jgi:hypothetical protein
MLSPYVVRRSRRYITGAREGGGEKGEFRGVEFDVGVINIDIVGVSLRGLIDRLTE